MKTKKQSQVELIIGQQDRHLQVLMDQDKAIRHLLKELDSLKNRIDILTESREEPQLDLGPTIKNITV